MTSQTRAGSLSRAAVHAQKRRDNEAEAREVLCKRLPAEAFRPEYGTRGEFNLTTKTLLATLHFLDPRANVPKVPKLDSSTAGYNRHRRANEAAIRDSLESILPSRFFTSEVTDRSDFNQTTKVMIAADARVQEILLEEEDAQSSNSTLSESDDMVSPAHSPTTGQFETPLREARRSLRIQQGSSSSQKQAVSLRQPTIGVERHQHNFVATDLEDTRAPNFTPSKIPPSVTSPSTRSSSNAKRRLLSFPLEASPPGSPSSDDTISASSPSSSEGHDLLRNLHADEMDQEMSLDVRPPPLPKKAFENQGLWQIKLRDTTQHHGIYIQALEQAANRLVAKAKELVMVHDGDDTACEKPLMEAQEWCIDTISMIAGEINSKNYRKKWSAKKKVWSKREDYDLSFDD